MDLYDILAVFSWAVCMIAVVCGVAVLDSRQQMRELRARKCDAE